MNREHILAVLYDLAMVIAGETSLRPLLTRSVQRLMYHTGFPVGLVLLDPPRPEAQASGGAARSRLALVIGDHALAARTGEEVEVPGALLAGDIAAGEDPALLAPLTGGVERYRAYLKLPLDRRGVVLLLAREPPAARLETPQVFRPVLANLARAVVLCRDHDAREAGLVAERDAERGERQRMEEQLRRSQRLDALGRLAGGIAHDFNNLLVVINTYTELAVASLEAGAPLRADLEQVLQAGKHAAALTRQLLAFGRRQSMNPVVLSLNEVILDLQKLLGRVLGEDVKLEPRLAPDLGRVRVDPSQVEQILLNLVVNARDAMPRGGTITVETSNLEMEDLAAQAADARPGRYVVMSVTDTGCGMSAETMARIFDPFFTTKPAGHGTGLGLATVYGIVRQSGGFVDVRSELGRGTTFRVMLPREAADAPEAAGDAAPAAAADPGETVLLVEDDEGVRRLVERVLRRLGYRVLSAASPADAVAASGEAGRVDLLLTDVVMPTMNGPELARQLVETRPDLAVVYVSGYPGGATGGGPGARVLQKPFAPGELGRAIREALDRRAKVLAARHAPARPAGGVRPS